MSKFLFKEYYALAKPGIIYGNLLTAIGGFLLASQGHINVWLLLATLLGTSLIIGSACVFNNYIDRNLDKAMERTKKRATVTGLIPGRNVLTYASVLGLLGVFVLAIWVNVLTLVIGLVAFFVYVVLYGLAKRRSVHGTVVGSIAGAAPIVAGYCAVTNHFDGAALVLFLILVFWQMPHFYAIAMYRFKDYKAAGLPVLPVKKGLLAAKKQILLYVVAFSLAALMLTILGYTGYTYTIVMTLLGLTWLWRGFQGFKPKVDDAKWARKMFFFSLIVITLLSAALSINAWVP